MKIMIIRPRGYVVAPGDAHNACETDIFQGSIRLHGFN